VLSPKFPAQRTWAYLESLFISSEEVKKELPEATQRFVKIDADVKSVLAGFKQTHNCVESCGKEGLLKFLEKQQSELEVGRSTTCCGAMCVGKCRHRS
jgi:dynein heavy chain